MKDPLGVHALVKRFGSLSVFDGLDILFGAEEITAVLGPSGCGKTTLLNILSGLLIPDSGRIDGGGAVSCVFQEPRLLPWMTLWKNLAFILPPGPTREERERLIGEMLGIVELTQFASYYPYQLSGGMRQRAALARAFAFPSEILLMDEPFQALDLGLRLSLVDAFRRLWSRAPRTTVFVTHDIQEALLVAHRLLVLSLPPARVVCELRPAPPWERRRLDDQELLECERRLYSAMLEMRGPAPEQAR